MLHSRPTELDALVFGHLFSILTTPLPDSRMAGIIRGYKNLVELCQTVDKAYFDRFAADPHRKSCWRKGVFIAALWLLFAIQYYYYYCDSGILKNSSRRFLYRLKRNKFNWALGPWLDQVESPQQLGKEKTEMHLVCFHVDQILDCLFRVYFL